MEGGVNIMFKFIFDIVTNNKFYLPLLFIGLGFIIYEMISRTVKRVSKIDAYIGKGHSKGYDKRKSTVVGLINNIIKYLIAIIVIISILGLYGVNTKNIVASLGIVSAVIGLAFQDIIKDFLSGIFIIFDNAYAVGDWVVIDDFRGEVIAIGLRTTKVRAYTGEIMSLSNSSFTKVINYNLSNPKLFLTIPFSYDEKIEKIEEILTEVLEKIKNEKDVKGVQLLGVESFLESSILYALEIDCMPSTQFGIKRKLLRNIKMSFDENGIMIPYNKLDVHVKK